MLDLKWLLAMDQVISAKLKLGLANWEMMHTDFEIFRELLWRFEYWCTPEVVWYKFWEISWKSLVKDIVTTVIELNSGSQRPRKGRGGDLRVKVYSALIPLKACQLFLCMEAYYQLTIVNPRSLQPCRCDNTYSALSHHWNTSGRPQS